MKMLQFLGALMCFGASVMLPFSKTKAEDIVIVAIGIFGVSLVLFLGV